jgi:hypothetical protein
MEHDGANTDSRSQRRDDKGKKSSERDKNPKDRWAPKEMAD